MDLSAYASWLNHLPIDVRAEVLVADMLDAGIAYDDLIIQSVGAFKRAFSRDVSHTDWFESQQQDRRWLQLYLNRAGLYDLLPEGVWHQPTSNDTASSKEVVLREMQVQHQREQAARRFFLPIEQEFFRQRVRIEQEQRALLLDSAVLPDALLGWFWGLPPFLTSAQTQRLLYIMPLMHQLAGNWEATEACFRQLIEEPVQLEWVPPGITHLQAETPGLGEWCLGATSVFDGWLGNEEATLRMSVQIDRRERLEIYLPGGKGRLLIDWLVGYLVPLDTDVAVVLDTSALPDRFSFTDEERLGRLAFSTYLGEL